MTDVERICETNYQRRKWAEELSVVSMDEKKTKKQKSDCRKNVLRSARMICMMAAGGAAAIVGFGLASGNLFDSVIGGIISILFMLSGILIDEMV